MMSPTIDTSDACAALGIPRQWVTWDRRIDSPASTQVGRFGPLTPERAPIRISSLFFGPCAEDWAIRLLESASAGRPFLELTGDARLRFVVAHELAHRWQDSWMTAKDRAQVTIQVRKLALRLLDYDASAYEVEADLIAAQVYGTIKLNGKAAS